MAKRKTAPTGGSRRAIQSGKQRRHSPARARRVRSSSNGKSQTIGAYLIQRLQDYGVSDLFGLPGDFVLRFYGCLRRARSG